MSQHDDLDGEEIREMWCEQGEAVMREEYLLNDE